MIRRLCGVFDLLGRRLVTRHPYLYLFKVHVLAPIVAVLLVMAAVTGALTPIRLDSVSDLGQRYIQRYMLVLIGSLLVGLVWVYFVARDSQRIWPVCGRKRLPVLLVVVGCLLALVAPLIVHSALFARAARRYTERPAVANVLSAADRLDREWDELSKSPPAEYQAKKAAYRRGLQEWLGLIDSYGLAPASIDRMGPDLAPPRHCVLFGGEEHLDLLRQVANGSLRSLLLRRLAVTLFLIMPMLGIYATLRGTSPGVGLAIFGLVVAYSVCWTILMAILDASDTQLCRTIGHLVFAHWFGAAVLVVVQWMGRKTTRFAHVAGALLALLTPFLALGWLLIQAPDDPFAGSRIYLLPTLTLVSCAVLCPFFQGNLARLRWRPKP